MEGLSGKSFLGQPAAPLVGFLGQAQQQVTP